MGSLSSMCGIEFYFILAYLYSIFKFYKSTKYLAFKFRYKNSNIFFGVENSIISTANYTKTTNPKETVCSTKQ